MIEKAISKILSLGTREIKVIDGRDYANGPDGLLPIKPPKAETLVINTLTGVVDFFNDAAEELEMVVHVISHDHIDLIEKGFANDWLTRSIYVSAKNNNPVFRFGLFMDVENFIINLQAMFIPDAQTEKILKVVGNIKDESVTNFTDDGVTQAVTAKAGIATVQQVEVPNPVTLRPFRTFMEVEQPESKFILRMKSGKGFPPSCALFEADGKMWELEAIRNIREWFRSKLPESTVIIA